MSLQNSQKQVDEWIGQFKEGYWKPTEQITALVEEVGELAREVNHCFGPKRKKSTEGIKEIGDEIGDVLFSLICIANALDIDLDEALQKAIDKKYKRDNKRFERK
ncbi:nucleotide pyrophosphohydrolase [Patescibacteria group bacterium AH-259-L05]|nr:nucleotide pyrophosphohydrolase [Patescibacteria group bacterium AH-259-L05]